MIDQVVSEGEGVSAGVGRGDSVHGLCVLSWLIPFVIMTVRAALRVGLARDPGIVAPETVGRGVGGIWWRCVGCGEWHVVGSLTIGKFA